MRTSVIARLAGLLGALVAVPAWAADAGAPPPTVPYDEPAPTNPAGEGASAPPVEKPAPRVVLPIPQAQDDEAPRAWRAPPPEALPSAREPIPVDASEPGRIVAESVLGFLTAEVGLTIGVVGLVAGPLGLGLLLAGPLATGGVVCAIGSGSSYFDGRCGVAIGGAYLGSLLAIPMGIAFAGKTGGSDAIPPVLVGALLGYVLGSTVGAVVGWNVSRVRKDRAEIDVARLDGVAVARALPWNEPLRPRGAWLPGSEPRLTAPLLAFRF